MFEQSYRFDLLLCHILAILMVSLDKNWSELGDMLC